MLTQIFLKHWAALHKPGRGQTLESRTYLRYLELTGGHRGWEGGCTAGTERHCFCLERPVFENGCITMHHSDALKSGPSGNVYDADMCHNK